MRIVNVLSCFMAVIFMISSCKDAKPKWDTIPTDLTSYGLPIIVQAPDTAEVKDNVVAFEKGVTIVKDDFMMEVSMKDQYADASKNVDSILVKKKIEIEEREDFEAILKTDKNGLIYSTNDTIIGLDHHFYYVVLKNGKQFEFNEAPNVMANYTVDEITELFKVAAFNGKD